MSGFKPYPAYKDSGVEWLGEVPQSWKVRPIKSCGWLKGGAGFPHEHQGDGSFELDFHKVNALATASREGYLQPSENTVSRETARALGAYVFPSGTIVFAKVGAALLLGRLRRIASPACIDNNMMGLVVFECAFDPDFMLYAMGTVRFDLISNPGAVPSLNESQIGNYRLAIPTIEEQTQIARFLDHETARIDALIEEQQRLIELLKEKRQAVISHAVTKGLDPTVPMKDSGVEWLGEVPAHWDVKRVKHITLSFDQGWSPQCENQPVDDDKQPGVLKTGCVNGGVFKHDENKKLPDDLELISSLTVRAGDLLVSRANTRELVGSAAVPSISYPNLMIPDKIFRIRVKEEKANPRFIAFYLGSPFARREIELSATGASSSMLNISQSAIADMLFPCPPVSEQHKIVERIVEEAYRLLALAEDALRLKKLLQERRSALISAAVTGKIDVRNWQPPAEQYQVGDAQNHPEPEAV